MASILRRQISNILSAGGGLKRGGAFCHRPNGNSALKSIADGFWEGGVVVQASPVTVTWSTVGPGLRTLVGSTVQSKTWVTVSHSSLARLGSTAEGCTWVTVSPTLDFSGAGPVTVYLTQRHRGHGYYRVAR